MNRAAFLLATITAVATLWTTEARATKARNGFYLNTDELNGFYLNTDELNGFYLNTATLNAGTADGVSLSGVKKNAQPVSDVKLEGSELTGSIVEPGGCNPAPPNSDSCVAFQGWRTVHYRGAWFVGATLEATAVGAKVYVPPSCTQTRIVKRDAAAAPKRLTLQIASYTKSGPDALYVVTLGGTRDPKPLCGTELVLGLDSAKEVPVAAIPLIGAWNPFAGEATGGARTSSSPNVVTFACLNGALGKCAHDLGYRPWELLPPACATCRPTTKASLHQACTRMIRADYCGDGTPHTIAGTKIDLYDRYGFNKYDGGDAAYSYEAAWDEQGATQLNCARAAELFPVLSAATCPSLARKNPQVCWPINSDGDGSQIMPSFQQITSDYPTAVLANSHIAPKCDSIPIPQSRSATSSW
jgi:hypothetical protein